MSRRLREFVENGGGFGVCAGAFLPLRESMGMCESTSAYFRERGFPMVNLNPDDPVARGVPSTTRLACCACKHTTRLVVMRANGLRIVVFSVHPDCDMSRLLEATSEANVVANARLFKNAVLYCGGEE